MIYVTIITRKDRAMMKEELKNIMLMGLGAISLTGEKASALKKELLEKGEEFYQEGRIKNEELKRELKNQIKESITIEVSPTTKEEMVDIINKMSEEEKKEMIELLKGQNSKKEKIEIKENKE